MPNNNSEFSSSYAGRGCGCCAHCRCTGACGSMQDKSEHEQSPTVIRQKTPVPVIPVVVMDDKESVLNGPAYNKSLWSTLESLPHPNDLIMSKNSSRKEMLLSPEPLTPFMSTNQQQQQQQQAQSRSAIGMNRIPSSVALNNGQSSPPLPSLPKKEKKIEDSKSHKRIVNKDETTNAFPDNKPNPRLPSRKGLPEGGLSIDVPKTKEGTQIDEEGHIKRSKSKQDINHTKHTKAKVRNLSRKSISKKVESTEEEEEESEEESIDRSKKKKHKEYVENEHEQTKLSHKSSSKLLNRKSSQHWKEQEQKIDSEEETIKVLPSKPKMCRKCSMNTLAKLKMTESEYEQQQQQFGLNQTITPQLGTFSSPRFDQNAFQDREKVHEEILLQQLQRQRDREWEREQEREREQFAREIAQRAGGYNENGHGRKSKSSSKIHSPSIQRQSSRHSLNSGRKIVSSSDNDEGSGGEESNEHHEEEIMAKKHKKHHKKKSRSSRTSKKHHSETAEEETSKDDEVKARNSRKTKSSSKSKKYYETSPTSEEAEEVHQRQDDTSQEDEEEEDVVEMKNSKKTKKKSKQTNETIPDIIKEEDEDKQPKQSPLRERSDAYPTESVNSNAVDRNNLGPNVAEPQELKHTISIGNFSITRTRTVKPLKEFGSSPALRSLAKMEQEKEDDSSSIELKREKLKKILDSKAKTLNPKSSFAILSSGPKSARENKLQNEALIVPRLRSMPSLSTLNATKKLIVQHAPASEPNTLYFIDMTQMDEYGNPFIAFRLHADPTSNQGNEVKLNKKGHDWLMQSHETGSKLKSRLWLSAGKDGPLMFVIDIKSRRVDKFIIQGAPNHLKKFTDSPNWGTHEDYRHLYCQSPEKKQLKWFVQEPGKLMRLFGRSEDDHGHVYAEARLANVSPSKKNRRTTKEAALCFYDPIKEHDKSTDSTPLQMDIAYLCCTWFCARQTYDEGQFAAAHAEVEMIENIEKAFEVDLLAGA